MAISDAKIKENYEWRKKQGLSGKALENQLYLDAKKYGVGSKQLERAIGYDSGKVNEWINYYGRESLDAKEEEKVKAPNFRPAVKASIKPSQTAAGQLDEILASDSPLMKRAANQGSQVANSRGLLNSSMAAGASQGAMIDRAAPIASQDSSQFANLSQFNAGQENQMRSQENAYLANSSLSGQSYQQSRGLNQQNFGFQTNLSDQQYQQNLGLNEQGYQFDMGRMQQQFNNEMQRMGYAYELDQRNIPQNYAANISAQTLQNVQAIQADPNLEPAAKQAAIKNAIDMANANMSWAETFYNTPMPALRTPGAA